jgi:hypothetical protein
MLTRYTITPDKKEKKIKKRAKKEILHLGMACQDQGEKGPNRQKTRRTARIELLNPRQILGKKKSIIKAIEKNKTGAGVTLQSL